MSEVDSILGMRSAGLRLWSPRTISARMLRMFLLDFGLGGPQQHLIEMANRLQRFRLTEAHTAAGTKAALSGNLKLI